jgi:hypothetical protein
MLWLDNLGWPLLLIAGGLLALAPFTPEPHLIEKLRMLLEGRLVKPIDIFDLIMHASPLVLMVIKLYRQLFLKS